MLNRSRSAGTTTILSSSLQMSKLEGKVLVDDNVTRKSPSNSIQKQCNRFVEERDTYSRTDDKNIASATNNGFSSAISSNSNHFDESVYMSSISPSTMRSTTTDDSQHDYLRSRSSFHGTVATTPIAFEKSTNTFTSPKQRNGTPDDQLLQSPMELPYHLHQNGKTNLCKKSNHRIVKKNGKQNDNLSTSLHSMSNSNHANTTKKTSPTSTKSVKRSRYDDKKAGLIGQVDDFISMPKVWKNGGNKMHTIALFLFLLIVTYSVGCFVTIHRTIVDSARFPSSDKNIINVPFSKNYRKDISSQRKTSQNNIPLLALNNTKSNTIDSMISNRESDHVNNVSISEKDDKSSPLANVQDEYDISLVDPSNSPNSPQVEGVKQNVVVDEISRVKLQPRIMFLDSVWSDDDWHRRRDKSSISSLHYNYTTGNEYREHYYPAGMNDEKCIAKSDWQVHSKPNCNNIHEIDFAIAAANALLDHDPSTSSSHHHKQHLSYYTSNDKLKALGEGWFRTTWQLDRIFDRKLDDDHHHHDKHHDEEKVDNNSDFVDSVVLKTLRIERDFLSEFYELHRRDAVAMERLTGSDYVVNVFAFCAQSAINELANFNYPGIQNLESFNRRLRGINNPQSSAIKIRIAASIALGLADIHAAGEESTDDVFMVHYDLNPRNIALFAGGKPKINDFNIAEFIRRDPSTNISCGFPSRLHEPWWRAPEEMNLNATADNVIIDEKVDIYALGNILFHTLTSHAPWGKMRHERIPEVIPLVAVGKHPDIPKLYLTDKDRNVKALVKAIKMCWVKNPTERATAHDVASVLIEPLLRNNNKVSAADKGLPMWNDVPNSNSNTKQMDNDDTDDEDAIENKGAIAG